MLPFMYQILEVNDVTYYSTMNWILIRLNNIRLYNDHIIILTDNLYTQLSHLVIF